MNAKVKHWAPSLLIAASFICLIVWSAQTLSSTQDEPLHISSGAAYWQYHDYRLQPENGVLPQRLIGLLPSIKFPERGEKDMAALKMGRQWELARSFLKNNGRSVLILGRVSMLLMGLLFLFIYYRIACTFLPTPAAVLALGLLAGSPTWLALSSQATSDLSLAVFFFLAATCLWFLLQKPSWHWILLTGLTCGMAATSKYSAIALIPVALGYWLWFGVRSGNNSYAKPLPWLKSLRNRFFALLFAACIAYSSIWAFYGFRYSATGDRFPTNTSSFQEPWDTIRGDNLPTKVIAFLENNRLLPEAYLYGAQQTYTYSRTRLAYFLGEIRFGGWRAYFPTAFVLKSTPVTLGLLLFFIATFLTLLRKGGHPKKIRQWLQAQANPITFASIPFLAYLLFCLTSNLNIGYRHFLPALPSLFILLSTTVTRIQQPRIKRFLPTALILAQFSFATAQAPNFLSYFNPLVGGPMAGWRYLSDSSLDWGQEMYRLTEWEQKRGQKGIPPAQYILFATMPADYYDLQGKVLYQFGGGFPFQTALIPYQPGTVVISTTMLTGQYLQPSYQPGKRHWTELDQQNYQLTKRMFQTLLQTWGEDPREWARQLSQSEMSDLQRGLEVLAQLRIKRLNLILQTTDPVERIGPCFFVYELTPELFQQWNLDDQVSFPNPGFYHEVKQAWHFLQQETKTQEPPAQ